MNAESVFGILCWVKQRWMEKESKSKSWTWFPLTASPSCEWHLNAKEKEREKRDRKRKFTIGITFQQLILVPTFFSSYPWVQFAWSIRPHADWRNKLRDQTVMVCVFGWRDEDERMMRENDPLLIRRDLLLCFWILSIASALNFREEKRYRKMRRWL